MNLSWSFIEYLILSAGICLTYDNDLAIKRGDTAWKKGRDVWWQVEFCLISLFSQNILLSYSPISPIRYYVDCVFIFTCFGWTIFCEANVGSAVLSI